VSSLALRGNHANREIDSASVRVLGLDSKVRLGRSKRISLAAIAEPWVEVGQRLAQRLADGGAVAVCAFPQSMIYRQAGEAELAMNLSCEREHMLWTV
jgi:hypothetical protein